MHYAKNVVTLRAEYFQDKKMTEINFIIYQTPQGNVNVEAVVKDETLWLTQKAMAELFGVQVPAISKHLKNIFEECELEESMVVSKMEINTSVSE